MKNYTEAQIARGAKEEMDHATTFDKLRNNPGMTNEEAAREIAIEHLELNPNSYKEKSLEHGGNYVDKEDVDFRTVKMILPDIIKPTDTGIYAYKAGNKASDQYFNTTMLVELFSIGDYLAILPSGIMEFWMVFPKKYFTYHSTSGLTENIDLNLKNHLGIYKNMLVRIYDIEQMKHGGATNVDSNINIQENTFSKPSIWNNTNIIRLHMEEKYSNQLGFIHTPYGGVVKEVKNEDGGFKRSRIVEARKGILAHRVQTKNGTTSGSEIIYKTIDEAIKTENQWLNGEVLTNGGEFAAGREILYSKENLSAHYNIKRETAKEHPILVQNREGQIVHKVKNLNTAKEYIDTQYKHTSEIKEIPEYIKTIAYHIYTQTGSPGSFPAMKKLFKGDASVIKEAHLEFTNDVLNPDSLTAVRGLSDQEKTDMSEWFMKSLPTTEIPNNYEGKNAKQVWETWSTDQRRHFLIDHKDDLYIVDETAEAYREFLKLREQWADTNFEYLPNMVKDAINIHRSYGQYGKGGPIINQYKGRTPKDIWDSWNENQRHHFLADHKNKFIFKDLQENYPKYEKLSFGKLPEVIIDFLTFHVEDGQYVDGGPMDEFNKGTEIWDSKKNKYGIVTRFFKPTKASALGNEPFLIDIKFDDGTKAINMPIGDRFQKVKTAQDLNHISNKKQTLQERYDYIKKWNDSQITDEDIDGVITALINAGITDKDLHTSPTKTAAQYEKAQDKKITELMQSMVPHYTGNLKGNQPRGIIWRLVVMDTEYNDNVIERFKAEKKANGGELAKEEKLQNRIKNMSGIVANWKHILTEFEKKKSNTIDGTFYSPNELRSIEREIPIYEEEIEEAKLMLGNESQNMMSKADAGWLTKWYTRDASAATQKLIMAELLKRRASGKLKDYPEVKEWLKIENMEEGGKIGFNTLKNQVEKEYEGQKVAQKYQKEYGKIYNVQEAQQVGAKVAAKVKNEKMQLGGGFNKRKHGLRFNKLCPVGTKIQHLQFKKDAFTEAQAKEWTIKHKFKWTPKFVAEKENTIHARQQPQIKFKTDSFKTIQLTDGVQAVIGCQK